MSWNQITIDVPDELKDAVLGELSEHGVSGVWESGEPAVGQTRLVIYLASSAEARGVEQRIKPIFDRANLSLPSLTPEVVKDRDWTEEWKKSFGSFAFGNEFFVIPSWCDPACPTDRIPIRIDPGQAFGTGTHETTQLTVEALERWIDRRFVVLDLGTGSGILAIASRLLGATEVFACDIDPVAVNVAEANFRRNAESDLFTFCGSIDAAQSESFHLILCNLTTDLILSLFPDIDRALRHGGIAIFSGILNEQNEQIRELMDRFHYSIHEEMTRGEWRALVVEKNVA